MPSRKTAFAVAAHPDDIEFMMSGTLMLLKDAGYEIHYMNVANGSCGTEKLDAGAIVSIRRLEAMEAAKYAGAVFHESLVNDIDIFYEKGILARMGSVMREVAPEILLTQSPSEYMEDHSNTCRLAVTAAFCRGMRNFPVTPPLPPIKQEVTVYHSLPWGMRDPLRRAVRAELFVDITGIMAKKRSMLACHKSQKEWLDASQGIDSYLKTMEDVCAEVGRSSGKFKYAEGWRRHLHQGLCSPEADPLAKALGAKCFKNPGYEEFLLS